MKTSVLTFKDTMKEFLISLKKILPYTLLFCVLFILIKSMFSTLILKYIILPLKFTELNQSGLRYIISGKMAGGNLFLYLKLLISSCFISMVGIFLDTLRLFIIILLIRSVNNNKIVFCDFFTKNLKKVFLIAFSLFLVLRFQSSVFVIIATVYNMEYLSKINLIAVAMLSFFLMYIFPVYVIRQDSFQSSLKFFFKVFKNCWLKAIIYFLIYALISAFCIFIVNKIIDNKIIIRIIEDSFHDLNNIFYLTVLLQVMRKNKKLRPKIIAE